MDRYLRLFVQERQDLCALLAGLRPEEWQAATLDEGWTVEDLAAHIIVRERHTLALARALLSGGRIGPSIEDLMAREKERGHDALCAALRTMPPVLFRLPGPVARGNLVEAYIHNEDVRRGALDRPRPVSSDLQAALWDALGQIGALLGRRLRAIPVPGTLTLLWPGHASRVLSVGQRGGTDGDAAATLTGVPGDLLLWLTGRATAASIQLDGTPSLVAALRAVPLGL